ncbi:MAG: transposase [Ilumatobacter sp.]|nr:transposase [Ilumatobacter sp.]
MARSRKQYTPEFKDEAVALVLKRGVPMATVAKDLGLSYATLALWVRKAKKSSEGESPVTESERSELARLRRENALLRKERDILKKATALFAREIE